MINNAASILKTQNLVYVRACSQKMKTYSATPRSLSANKFNCCIEAKVGLTVHLDPEIGHFLLADITSLASKYTKLVALGNSVQHAADKYGTFN